MDIITIIGLVLGLGALIVAFILEGGVVGALLQPTAAIIVFGGLMGAVAVSFPGSILKRVPKILMKTFSKETEDRAEIMKTFMSLSEMVRREGLLSLEHELETRELSEFAVTGLRLVIDGADEEVIEQALNTRVENLEHRHEQGAAVFEAAAGYAPTMGVLGTVMGMVNVLSDLSNAEELGPKIAVAFIATLYGVGSANLIFMPIANKLKVKSAEEIIAMNMTLEGILLLRSGCNPAFMKEQMKGYLKNEKETEETEA